MRTSWVFGEEGGAAHKVLKQFSETGQVLAWADQWNIPRPVGRLASTIRTLILSERCGTYHVCGAGKIARFDWAQRVLELAGLGAENVVETSMVTHPFPSPRPRDTEMDTMALRLSGFPEPGPWDDDLRDVVARGTSL